MCKVVFTSPGGSEGTPQCTRTSKHYYYNYTMVDKPRINAHIIRKTLLATGRNQTPVIADKLIIADQYR